MKMKTRENSQNAKRDLTARREKLVTKAKKDCTKNPNTDSSKNLIFDQEHATITSIPFENGVERLLQKAERDCRKVVSMNSSKNRVFDCENATVTSITVVNALTNEVHLSNTEQVLNDELFSHPEKHSRELHLTKQYSASIYFPKGEVRKFISTKENEDAAINEIVEYVKAVEDAMGVSCLWKLEHSKAFYIKKKRIGFSQLERWKAQFMLAGRKIADYLFEPAQG